MRIDTHVHIGGDSVGFLMSESIVIEAMQKYDIDYALVSNGDAAEVDHEQKLLPEEFQISQEAALERTLKFARKYRYFRKKGTRDCGTVPGKAGNAAGNDVFGGIWSIKYPSHPHLCAGWAWRWSRGGALPGKEIPHLM